MSQVDNKVFTITIEQGEVVALLHAVGGVSAFNLVYCRRREVLTRRLHLPQVALFRGRFHCALVALDGVSQGEAQQHCKQLSTKELSTVCGKSETRSPIIDTHTKSRWWVGLLRILKGMTSRSLCFSGILSEANKQICGQIITSGLYFLIDFLCRDVIFRIFLRFVCSH